MGEKIQYLVQGSSPEPYIVEATLYPLTISCTCQAAGNGLPCKHRLLILSGTDPGIIQGDKSRLAFIAEVAVGSNCSTLLNQYELAKKNKKKMEDVADKAFKKYRDAHLALLMQKVKTDRAIIKAKEDMDSAIAGIVPATREIQAALKALGVIFL